MGLLKSIGALIGFYAYSMGLFVLFSVPTGSELAGIILSPIISLYVLLRYLYQIKNIDIKRFIASCAILLAGWMAYLAVFANLGFLSFILTSALIILNIALFFAALKVNGISGLAKLEKETTHKTDVAYLIGVMGSMILILLVPPPPPGPSIVSSCIGSPGYYCSNPVFGHSTGNITVQIGQDTGTNWTAVNAIFVPDQYESAVVSAQNLGSGGIGGFGTAYSANVYSIGSIPSGTQTTVHLNAWKGTRVAVGTAALGYIWVSYTTPADNTTQYTELASIGVYAT